MPENNTDIKQLLTEIIKDVSKTVYKEVQITIYTQLQLLITHANKLEFPADEEGISIREATAEEKLDFIARGLDSLIEVTKETKL